MSGTSGRRRRRTNADEGLEVWWGWCGEGRGKE